MVTPETLDAVFAALADPTRRAILTRLAGGEADVNTLAEPFEMSLPAVSRHLKVLEHVGLIAQGRAAQRRPCHLEAENMKAAAEWLEAFRRFWGSEPGRLSSIPGERPACRRSSH